VPIQHAVFGLTLVALLPPAAQAMGDTLAPSDMPHTLVVAQKIRAEINVRRERRPRPVSPSSLPALDHEEDETSSRQRGTFSRFTSLNEMVMRQSSSEKSRCRRS
jgi:hypothetical protein